MSTFDLNTFTFNGHTLRTILIDGKPWFLAADVCRALGMCMRAGVTQWLIGIEASDRVRLTNQTHPELFSGSTWHGVVISEAGLYRLVLRSDKPEAKSFQDWVTKEVLPRIRKDGGYIKDEEKVATGEITAEQAEANLWKVFATKLATLDAEAQRLTKAANAARDDNGPIYEKQRELRELLKQGEAMIAENEARAGAYVKQLNVVKWQRERMVEAKEALKKAANPGDYGVAA